MFDIKNNYSNIINDYIIVIIIFYNYIKLISFHITYIFSVYFSPSLIKEHTYLLKSYGLFFFAKNPPISQIHRALST